jgi:hypothetical protein
LTLGIPASEEEKFRHRYSFVDWNKAETYFGGFDEKALALLRRH